MATGASLSFDFSKALVNAEKLDKKISDMVANAAKLESAMTNAFSGGVGEDILKRIESRLSKIGSTKTDIHFDTKSTEKLYESLAKVLDMMQVISQGGKIELFDTQKLYDTSKGILTTSDSLAEIREEIDKVKGKWEELSDIAYQSQQFIPPSFEPLINEKTNKPYGINTKAQQEHRKQYDEEVELARKAHEQIERIREESFERDKHRQTYELEFEMRELVEKEAIAKKEAAWAKMTEDQKSQYIQKRLNEVLRAEQKHTSEVQKEYTKLSAEIIRIYDQINKTEKSVAKGEKAGVDVSKEKSQLTTLESQLQDKLARQQQIEQESGNLILKQIEDFWVKVQERDRRGLEERIKQQEEASKRYLLTPEGALKAANSARTGEEMETARLAVKQALFRVDKDDVDTIKKLNDAYIRLRSDIEKLTKAQETEKTLQPTIRNEYARLLKELEKLKKEREAFEKTEAYKSGNNEAASHYSSILAREQDLQRRIKEIKDNAGDLLEEEERKHAANVASAYLSEVTKAENARLELVKRRLAEEMAERSKYGSISSASANRLISVTSNVTNIQQEEEAVKKLKEARSNLNQADSNYDATLKKLNKEIELHEHNIKMATDATYRKKQADEAAHKRNTTFQGALDYSKQAKSIEEQVKAIQYLKEARDKLDRSSMSRSEYESKVRTLTAEINKQSAEVERLRGKQDKLRQSQSNLMDTVSQLKRTLAGLFSVSAIKGYADKVIEVRGEFELQHKAMQVLIGDVDKANELWEQTIDLAVKSPFRVKDLVKYTKQLSAYRIETELLHDKTKMLADISAGLGVDMNRLILAYGQVKAANYLRGTELRQFSEAGINILKELSDYFTALEGKAVSVGEVFERVSKRMVSFADVDAVLTRVTSDGGAFYRMQEQQAETMQGMMMNFRDSVDLMLSGIGEGYETEIKNAINGIKNLVDNWREVAYMLEKIIPLFVAFKGTTLLYSKGAKAAGNSTLWWNKALKANIGSAAANIQQLTWMEAKTLGVTRAQFAAGKATMFLQGTIKGLGLAIKSILPLAIAGFILNIARSLTQASREAKRFRDELESIKNEDIVKFERLSDNYINLVNRLELANEGSLERKEIIGKLNSEYGEYLDFVVRENTEISRLSEAYGSVVEKMREKSALRTFEKGIAAIDDSYGNRLKDAKEEFYELFEGTSIKKIGQNSFLIPTQKEIDDIYAILQQRTRNLEADQIDGLHEQEELIQDIVSNYYGEQYRLNRDYLTSIELLDIIVEKKEKEAELQKEINALYGDTLSSREANIALEENKTSYKALRDNVNNSTSTPFEKQKELERLLEMEKLDVIDIKLRFNLISEDEAIRQRNAIINWATESSEEANKAINEAFEGEVFISQAISDEMRTLGTEMNNMFHGNVDLLNRELIPAAELAAKGWEDVGDGIATVFSSSYGIEDENGVVREILVTPILPDGSVLSPEELDEYVNNQLQGKDILNADNKNIVIGFTEDPNAGEVLHQMQERFYELKQQAMGVVSEEDLSKVLITPLTQTEKGWNEYLNGIKTSWETQKQIIEEEISKQSAFGYYDEERLRKAEKLEEMYRRVANILGLEIDKEREKRTTDNLTDEQIRVIDNMNKKYRELKKTLTEGESIEGAFTAYKDAFEKAYSGTKFLQGKNIKKMTAEQFAEEVLNFPDRNDIVRFLDELAELPKELDDRIRIELAKGGHVEEMNVEEMQKEQDKMLQQIENSFDNYEISLELEKLNIPPDLAKQLFGVDAISLDDIRSEIEAKLTDARTVGGQEDYVKDLEKQLEKVKELEDKQLKERLKTYTEYLKKEQDERIKIKLEELRKLEEVEGMNEFNEEQKAVIKNNIRSEAEAELLKKSWESFEKSPDFLNLFDDISRSTTQSLVDMRTQLDGLRSSMLAAGLPASDLKEILDKINQVEEELDNREPFKAMKEDWKTLFGAEYKKALEDEKRLLEERNALRTEQKETEKSGPDDYQLNILNSEKEKLESMVKGTEEYETQKQLIADITEALYPNQQRYNEILGLLKQNGIELDEVQQKTRVWKDACLDIAESFNEIGNAVNQVGGALGTTLEQLGLMSEESKAIYDSHMNMANDLFGLGSNVMQLVANPTNPQAWIGAITSAISLIGNIAATGDAAREKEIQAEMKKIDRLERAYEKLEKAMEEAFNIDLIKANQAAMEQNINAQIKALEAAKAAEEAKKKTDQEAVDQYTDQIEELEERKAELQRETVERLGGTYDYAGVAEQFLDAWLSAFEETGDGLSGLDEAFDNFWKDILKKQVAYGGASTILQGFIDEINNRLKDGVLDDTDISIIDGIEKDTKAKLQEFFEYMNSKYNLSDVGETELSGLSKGIQGITETQADILAAYWNAVRFDVSAIRQRFDDFMAMQGMGDEVNPVENHLKTISLNTTAMLNLLQDARIDSESSAIRVKVLNM